MVDSSCYSVVQHSIGNAIKMTTAWFVHLYHSALEDEVNLREINLPQEVALRSSITDGITRVKYFMRIRRKYIDLCR